MKLSHHEHLKTQCTGILCPTTRKLMKAVMDSAIWVGFPEKLIQFYKAAEPFYFLEYGKNALPEQREYVKLQIDKSSWYVGEVNQAVKCGKGFFIAEDDFMYVILEGFWLDGNLTGLSRTFIYVKSSQELRFNFGNHKNNKPDGICSLKIGLFSYTGYYKNNEANGIGRANFPSGRSYFGEFKDEKQNGMGIIT